MRSAADYGCEGGVEVEDFFGAAGYPPGTLRLKVVVARRSTRGELLSRESNRIMVTRDPATAVEQIVRELAAKLAER